MSTKVHHRRRPQGAAMNTPERVHRRLHHHRHGHEHNDFPSRGIVKKILNFVELADLLEFRLVCKSWNDIICETNPVTQPPSLLWRKCRIFYSAKRGKSDVNAENGQAMTRNFQNFCKNSLITRFHCPHYHLRLLDVRFEIVRNFFQDNGDYIQSLKLDNCIMSLVSLQRIVQSCPNLLHFEICGMFHCINHVESLFPAGESRSLSGFYNLRSLTFESTYVSRFRKYLSKHSELGKETHHGWNHEPDVQDLNGTFIREILLSATQLEKLTFNGFGTATVSRTLQVLALYPIHYKMNELGFVNIPDTGTSVYLCDLENLNHMKLRKFSLTFFRNPKRNFELNESQNEEDPSGNLDGVLHKFLYQQHPNLEELDLSNCEITELIFIGDDDFSLPALKNLCLVGTQIKELTEQMDNALHNFWEYQLTQRMGGGLENVVARFSTHEIDEIMDQIYSDIFEWQEMVEKLAEKRAQSKSMTVEFCGFLRCFDTCSVFDAICIASVGLIALAGIWALLFSYFGNPNGNSIYISVLVGFGILYLLCTIFQLALENKKVASDWMTEPESESLLSIPTTYATTSKQLTKN